MNEKRRILISGVRVLKGGGDSFTIYN